MVEGAAFFLLLIHILTLLLFAELIFDIKGFRYFKENYNIPMAPIAIIIFAILYPIFNAIFPVKINKKKIKMIRNSYKELNGLSKKKSLYFLVASILLFLASMFF
jgi:hypothetical protein